MTTMPADLRRALAAEPSAKAKWKGLTPIARRDFIAWIDSAKQTRTREQRIERACDMLLSGKRRPCCFAVVPLDLHNALKAAPAAKARWRGLDGDARRDFIDWIQAASDRAARDRRVGKACALIAAGKQPPSAGPEPA